MQFERDLDSARIALRMALGLTAFLAGLDKYFDLLAVWPSYVSPVVTSVLALSPETLMYAVGPVEMAVGVLILGRWTRIGAYVAAAWLVLVALSLVTSGRFLDVAVRDVVMAVAAYALARLTEAHTAVAARPAAAGPRAVAAA